MASKYKQLAAKLPIFQQESSFQQKVDKIKAEMQNGSTKDNISFFVNQFQIFRDQKDKLEERISDINVVLEALSQLIVENMQTNDQDSVTLGSGATVYVSYEVYPSVKDKEALLGWVKAKKLSGSLTLPWQTLRSLCNELSVEGKPLPSGVECFIKTVARVRRNGSAE